MSSNATKYVYIKVKIESEHYQNQKPFIFYDRDAPKAVWEIPFEQSYVMKNGQQRTRQRSVSKNCRLNNKCVTQCKLLLGHRLRQKNQPVLAVINCIDASLPVSCWDN